MDRQKVARRVDNQRDPCLPRPVSIAASQQVRRPFLVGIRVVIRKRSPPSLRLTSAIIFMIPRLRPVEGIVNSGVVLARVCILAFTFVVAVEEEVWIVAVGVVEFKPRLLPPVQLVHVDRNGRYFGCGQG